MPNMSQPASPAPNLKGHMLTLVSLSPLPPADIRQLLQGIFADPTAPPDLAIEAFSVTAAALYGWCKPADIERAMTFLSPLPA